MTESSEVGVAIRPATGFRRWIPWVRLVVVILTVLGLGYSLQKAWRQLENESLDVTEIGWAYLVLGMLAYAVAQILCALFWRRVVQALGGNVGPFAAIRAFSLSQLGKYLPGKAMVVVIRSDLIRSTHTTVGTAVASVFIETLMWIFVGAQIASGYFLFSGEGSFGLRILALAIMLISGLVTLPPNFGMILKGLARLRGKSLPEQQRPLNWSNYFLGIGVFSIAWCCVGLSAYLILKSLPDVNVVPTDFGLILAAVALATVGGFVSLLPGGIGVRELVIIPLLAPRFSMLIAVASAILFRIAWIVAELLLSSTIEIVHRIGKSQ